MRGFFLARCRDSGRHFLLLGDARLARRRFRRRTRLAFLPGSCFRFTLSARQLGGARFPRPIAEFVTHGGLLSAAEGASLTPLWCPRRSYAAAQELSAGGYRDRANVLMCA